ncbi:hypothetical protein ACJX0J_036384 [Zea mays]
MIHMSGDTEKIPDDDMYQIWNYFSKVNHNFYLLLMDDALQSGIPALIVDGRLDELILAKYAPLQKDVELMIAEMEGAGHVLNAGNHSKAENLLAVNTLLDYVKEMDISHGFFFSLFMFCRRFYVLLLVIGRWQILKKTSFNFLLGSPESPKSVLIEGYFMRAGFVSAFKDIHERLGEVWPKKDENEEEGTWHLHENFLIGVGMEVDEQALDIIRHALVWHLGFFASRFLQQKSHLWMQYGDWFFVQIYTQ